MSFSPDGSFFASGTTSSEVYLWKYDTNGYIFHRKLSSSVVSPTPLFSPGNDSLITWGRSMIQLWPLDDSPAPASNDVPPTSGQRHPFILRFSPDGTSAAFARLGDNVVTVINPKSGAKQLIVDAEMEVYGLRICDDAVTVEGNSNVIAWDLPKGDGISGCTVTVKDSTRTKTLTGISRPSRPGFTSISPDLQKIAETLLSAETGSAGSLNVYNVDSGVLVWSGEVPDCSMPWFSQDGSKIWCVGVDGKEHGWKVEGTGEEIELVPLTENLSGELPWSPSCGRTITDAGEILSHERKRLAVLPPDWMSDERWTRVWSGRFLALVHSTLSDPVVLELE